MALFQKTVVQKRRDSDYNETLLLNTKKVTNFYPDTDGNVIFYYADVLDRKRKPVEYHVNESFDSFITSLRDEEAKDEDTGLNFMSLTAEAQGVNEDTTYFPQKLGFYKDHFVKAVEHPDDSNKSRVWISDGAFGTVQYKVDGTLTEIEQEGSASISV